MIFRKVRRSNDLAGWFVALVCAFGLIFMLIVGAKIGGSIAYLPALFFLCFTIFAIVRIVFPVTWEVVIEDERLRWGRISRLAKQKSLAMSEIRRVIYGNREHYFIVEDKQCTAFSLEHIIIQESDQREFVTFVQQNYPHIKIQCGTDEMYH